MAGHGFLTVPEELLEHAEAVASWYADNGYSVKAEPADPAYPYTPTLRCRRPPTRVFVEVTGKLSLERAEEWSRFGRSCTTDTRIVLAMPDSVLRSNEDDARLQKMGVGVCVSDKHGVREALVARDLAVNVELPVRGSLPKKLKRLLGPVYEQFDRSQWREGFEDACQVLQIESAKYLRKGIADGRITVLNKAGRRRALTNQTIDRMSLGRLAIAFSNIQTPNHPDTVLAQVLSRINKDRIGAAHQKRTPAAEARLRKNVGQHMYRVVSGLKAALNLA
ncbi:MAG: hypothetical protein QOJ38_835 [Solirubrobacterales bacterium]|jgi:hypothetical protein|nr:hypothetical protein [Solirubrobacterales bacterium]